MEYQSKILQGVKLRNTKPGVPRIAQTPEKGLIPLGSLYGEIWIWNLYPIFIILAEKHIKACLFLKILVFLGKNGHNFPCDNKFEKRAMLCQNSCMGLVLFQITAANDAGIIWKDHFENLKRHLKSRNTVFNYYANQVQRLHSKTTIKIIIWIFIILVVFESAFCRWHRLAWILNLH